MLSALELNLELIASTLDFIDDRFTPPSIADRLYSAELLYSLSRVGTTYVTYLEPGRIFEISY